MLVNISIRDFIAYTMYIGLNFAQIKPFSVYCNYNIIKYSALTCDRHGSRIGSSTQPHRAPRRGGFRSLKKTSLC